MDNAVALVQAFLRLHGYLTVTEFPILRAVHGGGQESITDLDILAFRFGQPGGASGPMHHPEEGAANALLGSVAGISDMIIGEVKEGRAELNAAATKHDVLTAALARFGCCRRGDIDALVQELLHRGRANTSHGHMVRLVAFGTLPPSHRDDRCHVILLGDIVAHLRADIRRHWEAWQAAASKEPGLGMLITLEKAERGHSRSARGPRFNPDPQADREKDSPEE